MRFVTQRWWTSMHVCKHLITQVGEVHVCNPHHPAWVPVQLAHLRPCVVIYTLKNITIYYFLKYRLFRLLRKIPW